MADVTFPLAPASVQNGAITLDLFVKEPTRISNYVSQLVQANLVSQFVYSSAAASGGAIMFDQVVDNAATADQEPGVIAPGGEFPVLGTGQGEPVVKAVVKTGGKFSITREAMKRNDPTIAQRNAQRVANTMVKDIDRRAFSAITEDLATVDGALTFESAGWQSALDVAGGTKTAKTGDGQVVSDLLDAKLLVEETGLGYSPDTFVMSPQARTAMQKLIGLENWQGVLQSLGLTAYTTTALTDPGEALLLQRGAVGVMGVEDLISTDNEYVKATQQTWFYTWASMAFGLTDPFAVVKITGLEK